MIKAGNKLLKIPVAGGGAFQYEVLLHTVKITNGDDIDFSLASLALLQINSKLNHKHGMFF
jgi:hypothetical protein